MNINQFQRKSLVDFDLSSIKKVLNEIEEEQESRAKIKQRKLLFKKYTTKETKKGSRLKSDRKEYQKQKESNHQKLTLNNQNKEAQYLIKRIEDLWEEERTMLFNQPRQIERKVNQEIAHKRVRSTMDHYKAFRTNPADSIGPFSQLLDANNPSIFKTDKLDIKNEMPRMKDIFEKGRGSIDINSLLLSGGQKNEVLMIAKHLGKEHYSLTRGKLLQGHEFMRKSQILMDKFFSERIHAINQYKKSIFHVTKGLPIKFISFLNKEENAEFREKHVGRISDYHRQRTQNNQIPWSNSMDYSDEAKMKRSCGFVLRRKDRRERIENADLMKRTKDKLTFFLGFSENDKSGGYIYKRKPKYYEKHFRQNLADNNLDEPANYNDQGLKSTSKSYSNDIKIRESLNPRQKQILMNLVRLIILEDEAPKFDLRHSYILTPHSDIPMVNRTVECKNNKYRENMKRNLKLANKSVINKLKMISTMQFQPFKRTDKDEAVTHLINQKNMTQRIKELKKVEESLLIESTQGKTFVFDDKKLRHLPCKSLVTCPQVIFKGFISRCMGKKSKKFEKKYIVLYGYTIYEYNNINDKQTKAKLILRNQEINTQTVGEISCYRLTNIERMPYYVETEKNGKKLKKILENFYAYQHLVITNAASNSFFELNSKIVDYYQNFNKSKLLLKFHETNSSSSNSSKVDTIKNSYILLRSLRMHPSITQIEICGIKLSYTTVRDLFEVIEFNQYRLKILKLESCRLPKSKTTLELFSKYIKSDNYQNLKCFSLSNNKIGDDFFNEIVKSFMEKANISGRKMNLTIPAQEMWFSNCGLTTQVAQMIDIYFRKVQSYLKDMDGIANNLSISIDLSSNLIDDAGFMSLASTFNKVNFLNMVKLGKNYNITKKGLLRFFSGLGDSISLYHLDLEGLYIPKDIVGAFNRFIFRNVFLRKITVTFIDDSVKRFVSHKNHITKYYQYRFVKNQNPGEEEDHGLMTLDLGEDKSSRIKSTRKSSSIRFSPSRFGSSRPERRNTKGSKTPGTKNINLRRAGIVQGKTSIKI